MYLKTEIRRTCVPVNMVPKSQNQRAQSPLVVSLVLFSIPDSCIDNETSRMFVCKFCDLPALMFVVPMLLSVCRTSLEKGGRQPLGA